jgi:hypothetical protein
VQAAESEFHGERFFLAVQLRRMIQMRIRKTREPTKAATTSSEVIVIAPTSGVDVEPRRHQSCPINARCRIWSSGICPVRHLPKARCPPAH